jgi:ADP-heptose:LPS heptosyltransferase
MNNWRACKEILCVRLDNMGDILMSAPAILSLKKSFGCRITLLTSPMGEPIVQYVPSIDDVIVFDVPWVKTTEEASNSEATLQIIEEIKRRKFDGAVIFTVFSQSALPASLLLFLAGVPLRLAYCRENPYSLLTDWVPDKEPYNFIKHQVDRDLDLVKNIGALPDEKDIALKVAPDLWPQVAAKIKMAGVDVEKPFIVLHPSVSEAKRAYPIAGWIDIGKQLKTDYQILITGTAAHQTEIDKIRMGIDSTVVSLAGKLTMGELIALIDNTPLLITVNTVTAHIASAVKTNLIVLYAATNPQHTPWHSNARIFTFPVSPEAQSKNEVLQYVAKRFHIPEAQEANSNAIAETARQMLL